MIDPIDLLESMLPDPVKGKLIYSFGQNCTTTQATITIETYGPDKVQVHCLQPDLEAWAEGLFFWRGGTFVSDDPRLLNLIHGCEL